MSTTAGLRSARDEDASRLTEKGWLDRLFAGTYRIIPLANGAATKRVVYLADQFGIELPTRETLVGSFTSGYSLLDPTGPRTGSTTSEYRLRINVESETLMPTES